MKVLVLDGDENQAVACARSLGRAGHVVWVGGPCSWSKAGWSRFCRQTFVYPSSQEEARAFTERVAEVAGREPGTLVLPVTEHSTLPLSARRDRLFAVGARVVLPRHETVLRALDKSEMTRVAASLGIAVPRSAVIRTDEDAAKLALKFPYPAVLKPRTSKRFGPSGEVIPTGAPRYARDSKEFLNAWSELRRRAGEVLAQEWIDGAGAGFFALMQDGEVRAEFAHRRIRDVRPTGSGSAIRMSVRPEPAWRDAARKILGALRWHGVAMVEFRVRPDGTPVFLEVNGRFWNSLALAIYAGIDFPALLAEMAEKGSVCAPPPYRVGVRCRWLLGDLRHLLEVWRGAPQEFPGKFPGRLRTLANLLLPTPGTFHDNFALTDPLPELGDWLHFLLRKLPAEWKDRSAAQEEFRAQRRYSHP